MKLVFALVTERFLKVSVETPLLLKETKCIMSQVFSQHLPQSNTTQMELLSHAVHIIICSLPIKSQLQNKKPRACFEHTSSAETGKKTRRLLHSKHALG